MVSNIAIKMCANRTIIVRGQYVFKKYKIICIRYMYKQDLALNNLPGLICHKTQATNCKVNHDELACHETQSINQSSFNDFIQSERKINYFVLFF